MKILVLNYEYPPVGGGGGAVCAQVADALGARGHEVWVHTVHYGDLPKQEQRDNLRIQRSFGFRRRQDRCSVPEMAGYLIGAFWPCWRLAKRFQPDVIHAHFAVPTGVLAYLVSKLTGIPYIITAHLGDVPGGVPEQTDGLFRLLKPMTKPIWSNAYKRTAVSHFVRKLAEKAYDVDVEVIPNPVPVPPSLPQRDWQGPLRLLFVGRFATQKNLVWLLQTLASMRGQAWRLTLVGDGPLRSELQRVIDSCQLEAQVSILGWQDKASVFRMLGEHHCFILPSKSEGMPVAVLEALAYGMPILASDLEPLRELVVQGENGFRFGTDDADQCREVIERLVADSEMRRRLGEASYLKAKWFAKERIIDAYETCLEDVRKRMSVT